MGQSPQTDEALQAQQELERFSKQGYDIALPALTQQFGQINNALQAGEPAYMKAGFGSARTNIMEDAAAKDTAALKGFRRGTEGAAQGGNVGAALATPTNLGQSMARALYGSRVAEAGSNIDEHNQLLRMALGQSGTAGSGSLTAFGNQLGAIGTMQNYNSAYSNTLGALNAASSLYGGLNQAGVFGTTLPAIPQGGSFAGVSSFMSAAQ